MSSHYTFSYLQKLHVKEIVQLPLQIWHTLTSLPFEFLNFYRYYDPHSCLCVCVRVCVCVCVRARMCACVFAFFKGCTYSIWKSPG